MSEIRIANASSGIVTNARVYDLDESLVASGYPMRTETWDLNYCSPGEQDMRRVYRLSKLATDTANPAHEQCLSGILVSFDLTLSNKAWVEAERYRFLTFVSSESTMHRITKFDIEEQCNECVDQRVIDVVHEKIAAYEACDGDENEKAKRYLEVLYNIPSGFRLTARMTTNYRCLKNIYRQRKTHRLPEWRAFCAWIETLPHAKELLLTEE